MLPGSVPPYRLGVQRGVYGWFRRHPRWTDALIAAVPFGLGLLAEGTRLRIVLVGAALALPLIVRRERPVEVLLWTYGVGLAQLVVDSPVRMYDLSIIIALYNVAAYGPRWAIRLGVAGGLAGAVLAVLEWSRAPNETDRLYGLLFVCAPVVIAWMAGDNIRTRRAYLAELEERARRLERERDAQARAAVAEERTRIARELHDVVAHNVGVMVIQADGAECALEDGDLADTAQAISAIGRTGRTALAEMRLLLGVLRPEEHDEEEPYAPQPGLGSLASLVAQVPLPVKLEETGGPPGAVPPGVGLTAYRIVQEALTNTMKHGGPGARVTVRVEHGPTALRLVVADDGRGVGNGVNEGEDERRTPGHGLVGMRERAALFGGSVEAGAVPGGGFQVTASLPWRASA
jgi:signal transduction histidine kinase